jgi:hypothetical protein
MVDDSSLITYLNVRFAVSVVTDKVRKIPYD